MLTAIAANWRDVVGDDVAQRCAPVALDGPRLIVRVDDPAWATQMRLLTTQILDRLHRIDGAERVTGIDVRAGRRVQSGAFRTGGRDPDTTCPASRGREAPRSSPKRRP